jgi:hypothetical protein
MVAIYLGLEVQTWVITACATGTNAVGKLRKYPRGQSDVMLAAAAMLR